MTDKYDDMISLPHHVSARRKHMSLSDRAAQFAPFAALAGYADAIAEAGHSPGSQAESNEDFLACLFEDKECASDI